jgi:hypothetical protein
MADDSDSWIAILLGVLGLVALAKILETKNCKWCNEPNPKDSSHCKKCGGKLE